MEGLSYQSIAMIIIFIIGYAFIIFEHKTHINKATIALLMAILCWVLQFADKQWTGEANLNFLGEHLSDVSQVVFFLIGALSVVEIINAHKGFKIITEYIKTRNKRSLLWIMGIFSFLLSAVLDNLTTSIVMMSLAKKLIEDREDRWLIGGAIVIAANAGGAWTPIGDVTTTMLWIGQQVSTINIMKSLFLPSVACMIAAFIFLHFMLHGSFKEPQLRYDEKHLEPMGAFIFFLGIGLLIFVPVFKVTTGLPPFMGILFALSVLWLVTDLIHRHDDRQHLRVPNILARVDLSGTLFFLGILLCIDALESNKLLSRLAVWLDTAIGNTSLIAIGIGLVSAIIDNVPLVAAAMGMYDLERYPTDSKFWEMIAYCAGTGGSVLIIGSAAGVVFMNLEKADFFWYLKKISLPALLGYFVGIGVYLLLN